MIWDLIRLHRILSGGLILNGSQESFDACARLFRETKAANKPAQKARSQCLVQVAHGRSELRRGNDLSDCFCVGWVWQIGWQMREQCRDELGMGSKERCDVGGG